MDGYRSTGAIVRQFHSRRPIRLIPSHYLTQSYDAASPSFADALFTHHFLSVCFPCARICRFFQAVLSATDDPSSARHTSALTADSLFPVLTVTLHPKPPPSILRFPFVVRHLADSMLPTNACPLHPCLPLLQYLDDLVFAKSCLFHFKLSFLIFKFTGKLCF